MHNPTEGIHEMVPKERREEEITDMILTNNLNFVSDYMDTLVHNAYIAGYQNSRQLGLNIPIEERAAEYCKLKGLRE